MKLTTAEFRAMNSPARRLMQRSVEWPMFLHLGLGKCAGKDVVELGCGSGYGATLICRLSPRSYVGFDVMPEQIALAEKRALAHATFQVGDASHMQAVADQSKDVVVMFGILHHVVLWEQAISECHRMLRTGGVLLVEEPDAWALRRWDRIFRWDHPQAGFSLASMERVFDSNGWVLDKRIKVPGCFGWYRARKVAT